MGLAVGRTASSATQAKLHDEGAARLNSGAYDVSELVPQLLEPPRYDMPIQP